MQDKIFQKLKQEYYSLGLGDDILKAQAESLSGFVTEDNLDVVVASQKGFFERLQKDADKRVKNAVDKAKKSAIDAYEEELKKKKNETPKVEVPERPTNEVPEWYKTLQENNDKRLNEISEANQALLKKIEEMNQEREIALQNQKKVERQNLIVSKAKEMGIPQYRIDEGFAIADDADDTAVSDYLSKISNNIKTQMLPNNKGGFPFSDNAPSTDEVKSIAKSLVR